MNVAQYNVTEFIHLFVILTNLNQPRVVQFIIDISRRHLKVLGIDQLCQSLKLEQVISISLLLSLRSLLLIGLNSVIIIFPAVT